MVMGLLREMVYHRKTPFVEHVDRLELVIVLVYMVIVDQLVVMIFVVIGFEVVCLVNTIHIHIEVVIQVSQTHNSNHLRW